MPRTTKISLVLPLLLGSPALASPAVQPGALGAGHFTSVSLPGLAVVRPFRLESTTTPGAFAHGLDTRRGDNNGNHLRAVTSYDAFAFDDDIDAVLLNGSVRAEVRTATLSDLAGSASSYGVVLFTLTEPLSYTLTGSLDFERTAANGPGSIVALAGLRLSTYNPFADPLLDAVIMTPDSREFRADGVLQPGAYFIQAYASARATADAPGAGHAASLRYGVRLDFSPIPGPGPLALLALAPLAAARRRHR